MIQIFSKGDTAWYITVGDDVSLLIKLIVLDVDVGDRQLVRTTLGLLPSRMLFRFEGEARAALRILLVHAVEDAQKQLARAQRRLAGPVAFADTMQGGALDKV